MTPSNLDLITLAELLADARAVLNADAQTEARILIEHITGLSRARQIASPEALVAFVQAEQLRAAFARRAQGEPMAYIIGERSFWRHDFMVSPATLIPRPETEHLVEWALEKIPQEHKTTLVDLGTGSGVIALSLAFERPDAEVIGCDLSFDALKIAQANQAHILPGRPHPVRWVCGHWALMFKPQSVDVIVSNPPYIAPADVHLNQGDVRFEPMRALVASGGGLDDYRLIIQQSSRALKPNGWLLFEHGYNQAQAVQAMLADAGFVAIETRLDLAGLPRNTAGQIKSNGIK